MSAKTLKINQTNFLFVGLIILGAVTRLFFAINYGTNDTEFYLNNAKDQYTRFGLDKRLFFYPLDLLENRETKLIVLCLFLSVLYTFSIKLMSKKSNISFGLIAFFIS